MLCRDPAAAAELRRRGGLVATLTGEGSEYLAAKQNARRALRTWKPAGPILQHLVDWFQSEGGRELVGDVRLEYEHLVQLLAFADVPNAARPLLEAWRDAAWSIVSKGENDSLDGCYWLLHPDNLRHALVVPAAAPEIRQAADALVRWYDAQRKGRAGAPAAAPRVPVVFISSTIEDLEQYRSRARDAALTAHFLPVMKEYFAASGDKPPLEMCLQEVSGSQGEQPADVLVLIVAHRYGWVPTDQPDSDRKSITWLECEGAQRKGCEVLAFVVDKDYPWPDNLREEHRIAEEAVRGIGTAELLAEVRDNVARLGQFKAWIDAVGIRATFTTPDSLYGGVLAALYGWRGRHPEFG